MSGREHYVHTGFTLIVPSANGMAGLFAYLMANSSSSLIMIHYSILTKPRIFLIFPFESQNAGLQATSSSH